MELTQDKYEEIVFLTRCVYFDLPYPVSIFGYQQSHMLLSGLRMNLFALEDYNLVIICGTNSLKDWISNFKVGLNITPRQHKQALERIIRFHKGEKPLVIAGHSLGGGIAEYCASFLDESVLCISFNGCGVKHLCYNNHLYTENNIINIVNKHDILNFLTNLVPGKNYMKHLSSPFIIHDNFSFNPIKSHCDFNSFMKFNWEDTKKKINKK